MTNNEITNGKCLGELSFVGLGLSLSHISIEGIKKLKSSDFIFLEGYTSFYFPEINAAMKVIGIKSDRFKIISRRDIEEKSGQEIIDLLLKGKNISMAVIGDPFIATTHLSLKNYAKEKGCKVNYIPGINIFSYAMSATGLFNYKFGPSATIVYKREGILSVYPYLVLSGNLSRGLHTFFFLDIDAERGPLNASEAIKLLIEMEKEERLGIITPETKIVVLERLGWPDEKIYYGKISLLYNMRFNPPNSIIIPGKLHFMEEQSLEAFSIERNER
ncbi:diphthine synthase [Fervidicoccus fontis]|nr:diphthine synthase [Fervidicoccus fontis]MBE9391437.1 diphthine synthase [Fervidicoccus fontis]PMB78258.1 MAG: diphthine synthase [Fervidicoccus fontis]HEW63743.1 diphthine synthase [Fervidicoccus fontis]